MKPIAAALIMLLFAAPGAVQAGDATPLFASDAPLALTIRGPFGAIARGAREETPRPGTMTVDGGGESQAILLSPRGITRRRADICQFPPLRVEFAAKPAKESLFRGQRRLKLVTHCRSAEQAQQTLLLEYAAYRLYNAVTPLSFRVRLATINYVEDNGKPVTTRLGFFIEDADDLAKRNDLHEPKFGERIRVDQLSPADAGRYAVFEYMIGNLDWAMNAGPPGDSCCHNSKLLAATEQAASALVPVPYDFDFSGLVDAPYATPPEKVPVSSVRERRYRGYCRHNDAARAAAIDLRGRRAAIEGALAGVPQLEPRTLRKAQAYLSGFFDTIASDAGIEGKLLKTCLG